MAEDKDLMLQELLGMLGENPGEKIASALESFGVGETEKKSPKEENGIDIEGFMKIAGIMSELGTEDDRSRLLHALKPFLSEEKREKVDSAVKLLRLARMAEAAGKQDLLKNLKL